MLSLSASEPTVSATGPSAARVAHRLHHGLVDALDEVVAPLVPLVDGALVGGHLVVVVRAPLVFLVPQLDVGLGQARDQGADGVVHPAALTGPFEAGANVRAAPVRRHPAPFAAPAPRRLSSRPS